MRTNRRLLAVTAAALLTLGACSDDASEEPGEPTTQAPAPEEPSDETPTDETPSDETPSENDADETPSDSVDPGGSGDAGGSDGSVQDPDVEAAIEDLATDTDSEPADIEVISFEEVTWSDGSIGCPTPGQAYTQALVEGRLLILGVGGEEHHFHGQGDGPLSYCADPIDPAETGAAVQ